MNALERALMQLGAEIQRKVITEALQEAVGDNLGEAADLNVKQLMRGEDAEGDKLEPEYASDEYARIKHAVNPLAGLYTPDMRAEGDFHESIYAKREGRGFKLDARDWKKAKLLKKYGPLLGLQPDSLDQLMDEQIQPHAMQVAKEKFMEEWRKIK